MSASQTFRGRTRENIDALRRWVGAAEPLPDRETGLAPNITRVAEPLELAGWSDDSERRHALDLLQREHSPLTPAALHEYGVRRPGQTIYELQLAGYRIDRVSGGYVLWPGDRQPECSGPPLSAPVGPVRHGVETHDALPEASARIGPDEADPGVDYGIGLA